ncbi:MAG: LapA family protein, partial [Synechococcales cyanobacterium T60_A2020_003]|nr:LapA family protein [Synechococcales cyanobacterium T60_A2020_003]
MVRAILILLIVAGLALFAVQNAATVIPLVVLGQPIIALPLSVWILGAIAAGGIT